MPCASASSAASRSYVSANLTAEIAGRADRAGGTARGAMAASARRESEEAMRNMIADPSISVYDLLMLEFAMQIENRDEPGAMRHAYLAQLHAARDKAIIPRQVGVAEKLATMQEVLLASATLREEAAHAIAARKVILAEGMDGVNAFGTVVASPDETLMALMTRTNEALKAAALADGGPAGLV